MIAGCPRRDARPPGSSAACSASRRSPPTRSWPRPLPRAVQTAELLATAIDFLDPIVSLRCLEPSAHPRVAANEVMARGASIVIVGHEPSISSLGAFLLGRPAFPPFRTAQCCAIENGKPTFTARADINQIQALFVD